MSLEDLEDSAIISARNRKDGVAPGYLFDFEDTLRNRYDVDIIEQGELSYDVVRIVSRLRGENRIQSLSGTWNDLLGKVGQITNFRDRPYRIPSVTGYRSREYSTLLLFLGQVHEIRYLDALDWKDKTVILYIGDCWEPEIEQTATLIRQYDIEYVFVSFYQSYELLAEELDNVYWLPQGINPSLWDDYGQEKEYQAIQFGRKNPTLHEFGRNQLPDEEYVHRYIDGDANLARHINRSRFCFVAPRRLQSPELTGNTSPVTLRYFQAMACKSLPAGYKPATFETVFPEEVNFLEYETADQFKDQIEYYTNNTDEYWELVERNYEIVMENHTWRERVEELVGTISSTESS